MGVRHPVSPLSREWVLYGSLLTAGLILLIPSAVARDLWLYMEGRRAVIALEMALRGNWAVPHSLGEPVLTKPPLFYWIAGWAFRLTGSQAEWVPRVPSLLAALMAPLGLARMLSLAFDRKTAFFGGLVMLVFPVYHWMGQMAELDMLFVSTLVLAMAAFWEVAAQSKLSPYAGTLGFFLLGLSFLTKGPVTTLIVLPTVALWAVVARPVGYFRRLRLWMGLVVFSLPTLLWLLMLIRAGFDPARFIVELQNHTGEDAPHHEGWTYYLDLLEKLFFPWVYMWTFAALGGIVTHLRRTGARGWAGRIGAALKEDRSQRLLIVLWFLCSLFVLSAISSKRSYYGLALAPPAAALTAMIFAALPASGADWTPQARRIGFGLLIAAAAGAIVLLAATAIAGIPEQWEVLDGEDRPSHQFLTGLLGVWLAGAAVMLGDAVRRRTRPAFSRRLCLWTIPVMAGLLLVCNFAGYRALNSTRSHKRAVRTIGSMLPPSASVFTFGHAYDFWYYTEGFSPTYIHVREEAAEFARRHPNALGVAHLEDFEKLESEARWERLYQDDQIDPAEEGLVLFRLAPEDRKSNPDRG